MTQPQMAPICLVENHNERLSVNQKAIEILDKISQPVVVVAIVGLYRTGKSYLMNCLAGQNRGEWLPSGLQTKGIWMRCMPHPTKPKHTLVLLDTEGLGDVEKGDPKNDSWIFALAVLLSSTFVYNSLSTINRQALEQLHYVTELTELIRARSSPNPDGIKNSTEFVSFFPDFVWTVLDFMLELKLNGKNITSDEYLENALKLIPGNSPRIQASNLPRECIRQFFPNRKCFVFDRPTHDKELLQKLETISEDQLDPNFCEGTKAFVSYIFPYAKMKTLREGIVSFWTGDLVTTYVDAINSGTHENSVAVQKAVDHYSEQMAQSLRLPTDMLQELLDEHTACEKEAISVFIEHSFKDENQLFLKLVKLIGEKKGLFVLKNEEASDKYCQEELERLSKDFMENISTFSVPGGHKLYVDMREKIERDYWQVPRKGASEVFQSSLKSQVIIERSILQADTDLTAGEKAIAEERTQKEAAEKEQVLLRQKQREQQELMEVQEKSNKENLDQLRAKLVQERKQLIKEYKMVLEKQLKVGLLIPLVVHPR
uniref:Guanylate binding protein 6, pseudogene 1 n=1 Tax=Rattus norvegicus TaxID=10116 RepID=M0RDF8_RAT